MTASDHSNQEPELVVDDDWKSQVEKEKKQIQDQMESGKRSETDQIPKASFPMLVTTLASQAMVSLGIIPDPISNKAEVNKPIAKHLIDMLSMLEEKTKGNLTPDEVGFISDTVHQLRMTYVNTPDQPKTAEKKSTIELP